MRRYIVREMRNQSFIFVVCHEFVDNYHVGNYHNYVSEYFVQRKFHFSLCLDHRLLTFLRFKCEIFLHQETENGSYACSEHF